jgi:hypothetical protein
MPAPGEYPGSNREKAALASSYDPEGSAVERWARKSRAREGPRDVPWLQWISRPEPRLQWRPAKERKAASGGVEK